MKLQTQISDSNRGQQLKAMQALTAGPHQKYTARVDRVYPDQPSFAGEFERAITLQLRTFGRCNPDEIDLQVLFHKLPIV